MKKWMSLLLTGALLLSLTACKKQDTGENGSTQTDSQQETDSTQTTRPENADDILADLSQYPVLYQSGEHYAIYKNTSDLVGFYYIVKDQGGTMIDQGIKDYRGSFGFSYRNGLLVMDYGHGGNGGVSHRYYDVETGRVSDFFNETVADNNTLVAYFSWDDTQQRMTLMVQDIFDRGNYCVQIPGDYTDCAKPGMPVQGEFLENNTKLKFTYPTGDQGETVTKTLSLPGRNADDQMLWQVLRNEKPFTAEDGKTVYLQDYKVYGSQDAVVEKYAWVDLDGDGANALVAYMAPDLAYMVFYLEQGTVYGYEFGIRQLMELKADGTHYGSGGAAISTYYALRFKDGKCEQYELAYKDDTPGKEEYRVGGKSVTAEEFAVFYEEFKNKPGVAWYPYTGPVEINGLYGDFLAGKTTALENGTEKTLNSYLRRMYSDIGDWQYTFLDMNGDGVPELCVKHFELYIFTVKDGRVQHWYTDTNTYTMPLNNGALLMERHGAAPTHINYEYYTLDENGKENFRITFSWWDGATVEEGKIFPDTYFVNEQEVTKEAYEEKVGKYLAIDRDKIIWYHRDGEVKKLAGHTYFLATPADASNVKLLTVTDNATKKEIQTIRLEGNAWFTQEPIYTDITFDGHADILVPFQRPASAAFFAGYIWNEKAGQYVYAPGLENIPNIALDAANGLLLSHRTASQITSYSMYRYNADKLDFEPVRSLYWEPGENGMTVVEKEYTDGKEEEVKRFSVPVADGITPDKGNEKMAPYYQADSLWDLDGDKWRSWVYTP